MITSLKERLQSSYYPSISKKGALSMGEVAYLWILTYLVMLHDRGVP